MGEREKFKEHFDLMLNIVFWVKNHWLVFVVMGTVWTACIGTIIHVALIPMAMPIVRPIVKNMWVKQVAPYDSMTINFEERITNLENDAFPEAK